MPTITLKFAPEDLVERPTPGEPERGMVRSTAWDSTSGQCRYYIQWEGSAHARPYTDEDVRSHAIQLIAAGRSGGGDAVPPSS